MISDFNVGTKKRLIFLSIPDNFVNFESEFLIYDSEKWKKQVM